MNSASTGDDRSGVERERLIRVLAAATFLIFFQAYMVAPLIPRLSAVFQVSAQTVGLTIPAYMIPYGVSTLYGLLSDHLGRRRSRPDRWPAESSPRPTFASSPLEQQRKSGPSIHPPYSSSLIDSIRNLFKARCLILSCVPSTFTSVRLIKTRLGSFITSEKRFRLDGTNRSPV